MVLFSNLNKIKLIPLTGLVFGLLLVEAPSLLAKKSSSSEDLVSERGGPCPPTFKCDCCFDDEISFGSLDMYKTRDDDGTNIEIHCCPDHVCLLSGKRVGAWSLISLDPFFERIPINLQFEVPRDLNSWRNVQVDIHFIGTSTTVFPQLGTPKQLPVKLTGVFASQCVAQDICFEQCFPIPCSWGPNDSDVCKHFVVSFCINPKDIIHPGDYGQLCIELFNTTSCPVPPIDISVVAVSFRYRKKECKTKQICTNLAIKCDLANGNDF